MRRWVLGIVLVFAVVTPLLAFELQPGEKYIGTYTVVRMVWEAHYSPLDDVPPMMFTTFFMEDGSKYKYRGTLSRPAKRVDLFLGQKGRIFMRPHGITTGEKLGK